MGRRCSWAGGITGSLEKGKAADIAIINLNKPHLTPLYDIYSHIVYSARPSDVETVFVNGKLVVDKGRLCTADEDEILSKARVWRGKIRIQELIRKSGRGVLKKLGQQARQSPVLKPAFSHICPLLNVQQGLHSI